MAHEQSPGKQSARSPRYAFVWTSDPDSVELARLEVAGVAAPTAEYELTPGVWLVVSSKDFGTLATDWAASPPIFVRHVAPVHAALPLADTADDPAWLAEILQAQPAFLLARVEPTLPFSVQARVLYEAPFKPFDINQPLAKMVNAATGAVLDVRAPEQIISVACAQAPDGWIADARRMGIVPPTDHDARSNSYALVGISTARQNLSDWAGGMRRFAREEGRISRSEFKLLEAVELFSIVLPERGTALDLGAAPGGWTRILRQLGQYVTAVDPASLDPRLDGEKAVRHRRMTAQEFLREEPDRFDIVVNDMRMDAADSARLMVSFASRLYRHGVALMTLKLPEGEGASATLARVNVALDTLRTAYTIVGARQLFHNRSEITVALRPRSQSGA